MGKNKIPIRKIENRHQRHICFSKRRKGLFKKAAELCAMGCKSAIIVVSSSQNTFTFAYPDLDLVVDRFLDEGRHLQLALVPLAAEGHREAAAGFGEEAGEIEDEGMTSSADEEEDEAEEETSEMEEEGAGNGVMAAGSASEEDLRKAYWWNQPPEGLRMEEMRKIEGSLVELRGMAMERWNELVLEEPLSLCPIWAQTRSRREEVAAATATTSTSATKPVDPVSPPKHLDLELKLSIYSI